MYANDAHHQNRPHHLQSAENSSQQQRNAHELWLSIQSSLHNFFLYIYFVRLFTDQLEYITETHVSLCV